VPNRWISLTFLILSFFGFADAAYLTAQHYVGFPLECSILDGCELVVTSAYAVVAGVPVALLGALYYGAIFLLTLAYLDTGREAIVQRIAQFTAVGFVASIYFVSLQVFVLGALCLYCMGSALTSTPSPTTARRLRKCLWPTAPKPTKRQRSIRPLPRDARPWREACGNR